ncbi:hypothetical protein QJS04_geneDACA009965 [Acorus gramineus]|uniref:Uncharacterized protein n=1 Tax=Acorus gramineus TaxID=55184 RepID=A0AAV9BHU8_ACOGR|nr:hypothetical protein QJS04_geneDACA009965 [Acorus gramineus]
MSCLRSLLRRTSAPPRVSLPPQLRPYASSVGGSARANPEEEDADSSAASGFPSRTLAETLKVLSKRVPDSIVKIRNEGDFTMRYIPWYTINRILNTHAPEWSGEVRSITYSTNGQSVTVVYRVTLYGTDGEVYREATGTSSADDTKFGDPMQKAEAMAFRRACARLGLGLHLYHVEEE